MDYAKMTNEQIDAAIAERVMGWKTGMRYGTECWFKDGEWYAWSFMPTYDADDMMMVVEKMAELGWGALMINRNPHLRESYLWGVKFETVSGSIADYKRGETYADTLPRAVCEAALKAVEVEG